MKKKKAEFFFGRVFFEKIFSLKLQWKKKKNFFFVVFFLVVFFSRKFLVVFFSRKILAWNCNEKKKGRIFFGRVFFEKIFHVFFEKIFSLKLHWKDKSELYFYIFLYFYIILYFPIVLLYYIRFEFTILGMDFSNFLYSPAKHTHTHFPDEQFENKQKRPTFFFFFMNID